MFDPNHLKTQKHTFAHNNLRDMQLIVLIYLFIAISIENPRVGGSIPPPGTTYHSNINDLIFAH